MGIRPTGFSTPFVGLSWEYTGKKIQESYQRIMSGEKIKVFISSICGKSRYDKVRAELKTKVEETGLAKVYLSETNQTLSLPMEVHDAFALEDSDLCIFLIDNADGVIPAVQKQIDSVRKYGIKAICYFCDEKTSEKTVLEKSLIGTEDIRTETIHKLEEVGRDGADVLINEIISVYRYYCKGKIVFQHEDEEFQKIDVSGTEFIPVSTLPKIVLDNIDKCKEYILKFVIGASYFWLDDGQVHTGDMDDWGVQFLAVLFEGKPIQQFNTGMFLDVLRERQEEKHFQVVKIRWQAIQAHFAGDVSKCIKYLEEALALAKETKRPLWLIHDILLDLRNQQWTLCFINNHLSEPEAQKELTNSKEEVHYPILDRINKALYEKWMEGLLKKKIESPYAVTVSNNMESYGTLLASAYVISLYNGSLTHLLSLYEKIKMFLFYLSGKYDNWEFRRDMLKLAIFSGDRKEIKGIKSAYPEILNQLSESDASMIMQFCKNEPIDYKKVNKLLLGLGTVGYYLKDEEFETYSNLLLLRIKNWLNDEYSVTAIGQNIFPCLSGISIRLSQDTLAEICCLFMDRGYSRWYMEMFRFMEEHVDLRKMSKPAAIELIHHIIAILEQDKGREEIKSVPRFLYMWRKQDYSLTEELDRAVLQYLPDYYHGIYKLETIIAENQDKSWFIQDCVNQIRQSSMEQGENGMFFSGSSEGIAVVRNILRRERTKYSPELMASVISVAADTVLKAKKEITEKIDGVSLLICIAVWYPEDYERNRSIYENLYEKQEEVVIVENEFMSFNIDGISLKIGLQFLFASMGMDTSVDILELLPFIQNSAATTIAVTRIIIEYLELGEKVQLPPKTEWIVLQNALQWIQSDYTDIRWNGTRILMALLRNPENEGVINHKLVTLIDTDNAYIKNLIMKNLYKTKGIQEATKKYIVSKCRNDSNYVVRTVCHRECQKHELENEYSTDPDLAKEEV